ncbi:uncharacterized protein Nmag_1628 [Natrialba magadii ATCC 43099]|uniref:Uncharacterized protein n=1 Tax=Natrialba magadii (strain ATCC 43099 / DSM 3394 / CCM 3739 / CIP 104546 / IAM 13178 / JCM 8861 / NBRC 102185 / NCIMB 2190 / MS3) TaxID=547559 RepID=D3SUE6_NATMM|nr:hypothetical protein [Natrialba magadii]ADD05204.1 uncharacterized protein Nmag_1628 [Natrialba magadii ATCC 43099]ELY23240.1 hypothetical protein C500_20661 [Natrialba magadii ATCC 43099]
MHVITKMSELVAVSGTGHKHRIASSSPTALLATVFYASVSALACSDQKLVEGLVEHHAVDTVEEVDIIMAGSHAGCSWPLATRGF